MMEMFMNEISFQAVHFAPRFIAVITLLSLTWLVAKFAKSMVLRAAYQNKLGHPRNGLFIKMSSISFWTVICLCSPFILRAIGLDTYWLRQLQLFLGQLFSNWPIWMLISIIAAGVSYLFQYIPRFYIQLKGSPDTSPKEFK